MREFLLRILSPLMERARHGSNATKTLQDALGTAIAELTRYASDHAAAPDPELPPNVTQLDNNWIALALLELESLNGQGANAVCSVVEAYWKAHGLMNQWHASRRGRFYFRGEHHSDWALVASASRKGITPDTANLLTVTSGELEALRRFQAKVQSDPVLLSAVFPDGRLLSLESADWWALMQHYQGDTRLLDITSSLLCGLFFACANFNGEVDEGIDGALYLFPSESWRPAVVEPDIVRGVNVGPTDQLHPTVESFFDIDGHPDIVRFRESFYRNDRLLSQDGYFLWQPRFDEALALGQIFKFRVPASRKVPVLRELYSAGYTARRLIRPHFGQVAHDRLCQTLDVRP